MNEFLTDIRDTFYELTNQEIPLAVAKTVEAIWKENMRPVLHKRKKTAQGYDFTFALPFGMSFREFVKFKDHFHDAIGDVTIDILQNGRMAVLKVITSKIKKKYIFDFDHIAEKNNMVLPIPIGYTHDGLHYEDLSQIPHILIGGVTRSGKSNFLHTVLSSLLNLPIPPKIIIIDLKGLEYEYLSNNVLLASDGKTAGIAISKILIEMRNRIQILKQAKCVNIAEFHKQGGNMDYVVMIIDELAEINNEYAQEHVETLSALSAATGICLIMATQRPDSHTFKHFGRTKSNLLGRLCFRMADAVGSRIILDNDMASKIPNIRGRAIWKFNDPIELQVPFLDPKIAERRLLNYEQSPKGSREGLSSCEDVDRVGSNEYRSITNTAVSVLQSCKQAIKQIGSRQTNKKM